MVVAADDGHYDCYCYCTVLNCTCERSGRMVMPAWPPMTGTVTVTVTREDGGAHVAADDGHCDCACYCTVLNCTCESSGRMVVPAWPPMTGTVTLPGGTPMASARKVLARTTSRCVTPRSLAGSYTLCRLSTSATMGTVEFTGLEMTFTTARGHTFATPWTNRAGQFRTVQDRSGQFRTVTGWRRRSPLRAGTPSPRPGPIAQESSGQFRTVQDRSGQFRTVTVGLEMTFTTARGHTFAKPWTNHAGPFRTVQDSNSGDDIHHRAWAHLDQSRRTVQDSTVTVTVTVTASRSAARPTAFASRASESPHATRNPRLCVVQLEKHGCTLKFGGGAVECRV
eukprot:7212839-Pyramimonas_sp.AAC.1